MTEPAGARREYSTTVVLLAVAAGLLLLAFGRTWSTTSVGGSGLPTVTVALTGSDIAPAGPAVAVLSLAAVAGLVATRRRGRRAIGALVAAAGLAVAWIAVDVGINGRSDTGAGGAIARTVAERTGADLAGATTTVSPWWLLAALAGVLLAVTGAAVVVRCGRWPELGRRYERAGEPASGSGGRRTPSESTWDQLDRGVDPTTETGSDTMTATPDEEDQR